MLNSVMLQEKKNKHVYFLNTIKPNFSALTNLKPLACGLKKNPFKEQTRIYKLPLSKICINDISLKILDWFKWSPFSSSCVFNFCQKNFGLTQQTILLLFIVCVLLCSSLSSLLRDFCICPSLQLICTMGAAGLMLSQSSSIFILDFFL